MGSARGLLALFGVTLVFFACGARPLPPAADAEEEEPQKAVSARRADVVDDCAPVPGKPPPEPLRKEYTGVAAKARCQREVYTIMGGLTHFLGVKCAHCHEEPDYPKMTHNKHVANWMARELIPSLQKKNGAGEIWCNDCHLVDGKGTAKILENPRNQRWAVEWMTTHLAADFQAGDSSPLRCKDCHGGNLGTPEFQKKVILGDRLPVPPKPKPEPKPPAEPAPAPDAVDAGTPASDGGI